MRVDTVVSNKGHQSQGNQKYETGFQVSFAWQKIKLLSETMQETRHR